LTRVHEEFPWIGLVVLTSHQSPELAIQDAESLPPGVVYLVKTQLKRVEDLKDAVLQSISGGTSPTIPSSGDTVELTVAQAEVLRMLAEGASTRAIAEQRGTSIRAAETMLSRLYAALGVDGSDRSNQRVAAVRVWQQGRVAVQGSTRPEP
jgi:DNA-binding NarL/FixJ family response regulator